MQAWPEVEHRQLGQTSLRISIAGFGASPFGDVFGRTDPSEINRAVHFAIDSGINFFDVSPFYGCTMAETRLGAALDGVRQKVVLATKCGRYGDKEFDFSAARIKQSVDESLERLRTDYVDLLQVHDVEFGELRQIVDETLPAMRGIQQAGKARFIGITGYSLAMLKQIAVQATVDSILSYCRYNLLVTDMDTVLTPFVKEHGIGLINASPLHMGILTEQGPPAWHPAPEEVRDAGRNVAEFCRDHGVSVSEVAQRFCFDHPVVASTLTGMSTRAEVEACLRSLALVNDPKLLAELRSLVGAASDVVWHSGRPENYG